MATLDDKLMGEKLHYYCSSSEDEDEGPKLIKDEDVVPVNPGPVNQANTGPKGVIEDWRRYKQLETEKRAENEREKVELAKKLALTCRSDREDQEINKEMEALDLEEDEFIQEYMKKRMQEMVEASVIQRKHFGHVFALQDGEAFLSTVDCQETKSDLIMVLISESVNSICKIMENCWATLAKDYCHVKFCKIQASAAGLSKHFKTSGVPAILVYRSGELVHSFVRLSDTLGEDFYASDLESFLIENGVLSDVKLTPSIIKGPAIQDSDSD